MLGEIISSVLVVLLNFILVKYTLENKLGNSIPIVILLLFGLIITNIFLRLNIYITVLIVIFSFVLILSVLFYRIKLLNVNIAYEIDPKIINRIKFLRNVFFILLFPILLTIYQIIMIWNKNLQNEIFEPVKNEIKAN